MTLNQVNCILQRLATSSNGEIMDKIIVFCGWSFIKKEKKKREKSEISKLYTILGGRGRSFLSVFSEYVYRRHYTKMDSRTCLHGFRMLYFHFARSLKLPSGCRKCYSEIFTFFGGNNGSKKFSSRIGTFCQIFTTIP